MKISMSLRSKTGACAVAATLLLGGCATGPNANPQDPLEPLNRAVYQFNDGVDRAVVKPVATVYRDTLPSPVRTGVGNFFGNLRDAWSALNALLQARPREAAENFMRFNVNTVFGLGGLLDVATEMGIERTTLDFGHTLGRWGVPSGPYLMLPLLGPFTVRDTAALPVDSQADPVGGLDHIATRNSLQVLRITDKRASLLGAGEVLDQAALDPYSFMRDAYLQRRQSRIGPVAPEERYDQ